MRQPRLRTVLIATGATVALVAGSTTAYAAIAGPIDGAGVIHGCWTNAAVNGTHVFVLQDASTTCPKGTTAISWNQQVATGPAGPAGATGPAGPAGTAGPKGDTGAAGPTGPPGATGPAGPKGDTGAAGPQGPGGANGNTLLNGTAAPDNSAGNPGDFYLDVATDMLFGPKTAGGWPATGISLAGPAGPQGATGPAGSQGPAGPPGLAGPQGPAGTNGNTILNGTGAPAGSLGNDGDFYLDTAADTLYGPKADGTWPVNGTSLIGPPGAPGTGATVAAEPAGANCANGGAKVTDGNGNTAYACTGATGPTGPAGLAGTTGQQSATVYGNSSLTVINSASFVVIPGLTQTVTVPANSIVLVSTNGGAATNSTATTGFSAVQVAVFVDGARTGGLQGLDQELIMANTTGLVQMMGNWSMEGVLPPMAPGSTHTIQVAAAGLGIGGGSTATVGGSNTGLLQPELTVTILTT